MKRVNSTFTDGVMLLQSKTLNLEKIKVKGQDDKKAHILQFDCYKNKQHWKFVKIKKTLLVVPFSLKVTALKIDYFCEK